VDLEAGTRVLPPGEKGEVRARGPHTMVGYRNRPEETARVVRAGFIHTGGIGHLDADGFLFITDRKKDVVLVKASTSSRATSRRRSTLGPHVVTCNTVHPGGVEGACIRGVLEGRAKVAGTTLQEQIAEALENQPIKRFTEPTDIAGLVIDPAWVILS